MNCENIVCSERVCHKIPVWMLDLFKIDWGGGGGEICFQKVVNAMKLIFWSLLKRYVYLPIQLSASEYALPYYDLLLSFIGL